MSPVGPAISRMCARSRTGLCSPPSFAAYPGSPTLRLATIVAVVRDLLDSLRGQGFRRILIINGHGGNGPADAARREWAAAHPDAEVLFHNWWIGPRVQDVLRVWAAGVEETRELLERGWSRGRHRPAPGRRG